MYVIDFYCTVLRVLMKKVYQEILDGFEQFFKYNTSNISKESIPRDISWIWKCFSLLWSVGIESELCTEDFGGGDERRFSSAVIRST